MIQVHELKCAYSFVNYFAGYLVFCHIHPVKKRSMCFMYSPTTTDMSGHVNQPFIILMM